MTGLAFTQRCLHQLGFPDGIANDFIHADHADATNAVFQEIWLTPVAQEWKRSTVNLTATSGVASYSLSSTVQEVSGPVWFDNVAITPAGDEAAFAAPSTHFDTSLTATAECPVWYHIDTVFSGNSATDAKTITIEFSPTPTWETPVDGVAITKTIRIKAILQPPGFTKCTLNSAATVLPMPDGYVESLLLPLVLDRMASCPWFVDERLRKVLATDADKARVLHGLTDPSPVA